ncbi:MAG: ribonuclease D [Pelagibacteraceae bacterium]|nr:ribonuclease D [Pelagibacteraceae bacterium]MCI5079625.1 ribonuclease D [Pelagibacteraceae bacterium]
MKNYKFYLSDIDANTSLKSASSIAVDGEFSGLDPKTDKLHLLQLCDGSGFVHLVKFEKDYNAPNLKEILENNKIKKIFHFGRADLGFLKQHLNINVKNIFDTKIASKICRKFSPDHGLKDLCRDLLGINLSKQHQTSDWGKRIEEYSKDQISYACNDVLYLHKIKLELEKILIRENKSNLAEQCFNFLETRTDLDLVGLKKDIFEH